MTEENKQRSNHTNTNKKQPSLIGQGSYGCVFYPGIACSGKLESEQYVTKVQKESSAVEKEKTIGSQIRKIKKHYDYFAPIISVCPLKMASIKKDDIEKCNVMEKMEETEENPEIQKRFVSIKIRYVGKQTLKEHLLERLLIDTPTFFGHMLETQLYLCHSLDHLVQAGIIHYDLKSNNIMFHEKIQNPVIIDFGMSVHLKKLVPENYRHTFFDYYEKYAPWCIDIVLLSYLVDEIDWQKTKITNTNKEKLNDKITTYFSENPSMIHCIETRNKTIENTKKYWFKWVESHVQKTKTKAVESILSNWQTWDMYSLCVLYYRFMKENVNMSETSSFVDMYLSNMEEYITCPPSSRKTPSEMRNKIEKFLKSISRKEFLEWNKKLSEHQKKPDVIEEEKSSVLKDKENNKKLEHKLFGKKEKKSNNQTIKQSSNF